MISTSSPFRFRSVAPATSVPPGRTPKTDFVTRAGLSPAGCPVAACPVAACPVAACPVAAAQLRLAHCGLPGCGLHRRRAAPGAEGKRHCSRAGQQSDHGGRMPAPRAGAPSRATKRSAQIPSGEPDPDLGAADTGGRSNRHRGAADRGRWYPGQIPPGIPAERPPVATHRGAQPSNWNGSRTSSTPAGRTTASRGVRSGSSGLRPTARPRCGLRSNSEGAR